MNSYSDITFIFYFSGSLNDADIISVEFPDLYSLELAGLYGYDCNLTVIYQDSFTTEMRNKCYLEKYSINFPMTLLDILLLTESDILHLTIYQVQNPKWGFSQADSNNFFTGKFEIMIYAHNEQKTIYKTNHNLHSGYGTVEKQGDVLKISNYNFRTTKNRIIAYPNTQTDYLSITIEYDWPNYSKFLTLTGRTVSGLILTSDFHNWVFNPWTSEILFRVAATSDIEPGIYWIEWIIEETKGICGAKYFETFSQRTLVEVPGIQQFSIDVKIPEIYKNQTSFPIGITLERAPAEELVLSVFIEDSNFIVEPEELIFIPEIKTLYFTITAPDQAESTKMRITTSGKNKDSYASINEFTLQVSDEPNSDSTPQVIVETNALTENSVEIAVTGGRNGLLYYWLQCGSGYSEYSLEELLELIGKLEDWYGDEPIYKHRKELYKNIDLTNYTNDIFEHFFEQYRIHCNTPYISAVPYSKDDGFSITFDWLYSDNPYTFFVLLDHKSGDIDTTRVSFTTLPTPNLYQFQLTVTTDISTEIDRVKCIIAKDLKIPVQYLSSVKGSDEPTRRLQTTSIGWNIISDRANGQISPSVIAGSIDETQLKTVISSTLDLPISDLTIATLELKNLEIVPLFENTPKVEEVGVTYATFSSTSQSIGLYCTICIHKDLDEAQTSPSPQQIYTGLTVNSNTATWSCNEVEALIESTIRLDELLEDSVYYCHFALCNDYPLWPTCSYGVSESLSPIQITIKTLSSEHEEGWVDWIERVSEQLVGPVAIGSIGASTLFTAVFSSDLSFLWSFINVAQILAYLPVQNIEISDAFVNIWGSFGISVLFLPNINEEVLSGYEPPEAAKKWVRADIETTSLFFNIGEPLFIPYLLLLALPLFLLFKSQCKSEPKLQEFSRKFVKDYKWCFFIRTWFEIYVEVMIACLLCFTEVISI